MKGIKATYSTWGRTKDFLCAVGLKTMLNLKDKKGLLQKDMTLKTKPRHQRRGVQEANRSGKQVSCQKAHPIPDHLMRLIWNWII